jgi:hypothetical protein
MFAAIMGQFMTVIAAWKLEQSITIGLLEYLLASRSLGSAFLSLMKLRIFNTWVPLVLGVWCLSPLGGQASLRAVTSMSGTSPMQFIYLDNNNTNPVNYQESNKDRDLYGAAINAVFVAALAGAFKNESRDMYGNLHLPMLEAIPFESDINGWYDLRRRLVTPHPALLGMPFSGVPSGGNSSFSVSTSYVFCNCTAADQLLATEAYDAWKITVLPESGLGANTTTVTYGVLNSTSGPRLQDSSVGRRWNDTLPRTIELRSFASNYPSVVSVTDAPVPDAHVTDARCTLSTTYIELQIQCDGGPLNCTATAVRKDPRSHLLPTATTLDCIWNSQCDESDGRSAAKFADAFFRNFMNSVPGSTLVQYILTPRFPFSGGNSSSSNPITDIGPELLSQRLTQLLNTYLLASSVPYAISGGFDYTGQEGDYPVSHSISITWPTYGIVSTQGRVQRPQLLLRCHVLWTIVLIAISSLLIAAGLSTAILDSRRKGPQVLDDFTSSLRYNPYSSIEQKNSIEDGIDIARRSRHVRVQLGDVRPHDEVGLVAVATMGDDEGQQTVERLRRRRLYA